jgi:hypothetical protein
MIRIQMIQMSPPPWTGGGWGVGDSGVIDLLYRGRDVSACDELSRADFEFEV